MRKLVRDNMNYDNMLIIYLNELMFADKVKYFLLEHS